METANKRFTILMKSNSQEKLKDVLPIMSEVKIIKNNNNQPIGMRFEQIDFSQLNNTRGNSFNLITKFKVHSSINTSSETFNILETPVAFIEELEFQMPENLHSLQFNRDTTKNILGITEIKNLDMSSLLSLRNMFAGCWDLKNIEILKKEREIKEFETINADGMFSMCGSLEAIPENLDTSAVISMNKMFDYCVKLKSIPENFDTSRCKYMQATFRGCRELVSIPNLNTLNVINFKECFAYCQSLDTIPELDMSSAENMKLMFLACKNITEIGDMSTPKLETIEGIFKDCSLLGSVGKFNTEKVKYFNDVFNGCRMLNKAPDWNTRSAISMARMFKDCENLLALPEYDMTHVSNVEEMFFNCSSIISDFTEKFDVILVEREPEVVTRIEEVEVEEIVIRKDEDGNEILDENGNKIYDTIIVKKEQEVSEIIWHEKLKLDTKEVTNCIDKRKWWRNYIEVPEVVVRNNVYVNTGNTITKGKFDKFKDCFTGCSFYNQKAILTDWYREYPDVDYGTVYIYKVNYKTTSVTVYDEVIHKFIKIETLDDIKILQEQMKKLLNVVEVNIESIELFETYFLSIKSSEN